MLGIAPAGPAQLMSTSPLLRNLDASSRKLLEIARRAGIESGARVWWVGGGVRDLLLGRARGALDLDLVIEGDLDDFVDRFATATAATRVTRSAFLTAELELADGARLDVVRARRERYRTPGALPEVEPTDLECDLRRRDFTVNSMALEVAPEPGGALVDPSGGRADLAARRLRVHHERSFSDDPTRIFRGIDFEARFDFRLDDITEAMARQSLAAGALDALTPARLRNVLTRCFGRAATAAAAWARAEELGATGAIDPALAWTAEKGAALDRSMRCLPALSGARPPGDAASFDVLLLGFGTLLAGSSRSGRERVARRLALDSASSTFLLDGLDRVAAAAGLDDRCAPSEAHRSLRAMSGPELALAAATSPALERWVRREVEELRPLRLGIDGRALLDRGVPPGRPVGDALALTLDARLDGRIGADEELAFALELARGSDSR